MPLAGHVDLAGTKLLTALLIDEAGDASLADLPEDTGRSGQASPEPFARQVDGVAVSPDGDRIAYQVGADAATGTTGVLVVRTVSGQVVARQPGVTGIVVGWNASGILTRSTDLRSTQVWLPPTPGVPPGAGLHGQPATALQQVGDVVQAPTHSDRVLLRYWHGTPSSVCPTEATDVPPFGTRPSFDSGPIWPATRPWYRASCLTPGADSYAVIAPGSTGTLWTGTAEDRPQSISDDGRYLVLGDLEVVDLSTGARTSMAPVVSQVARRLNHSMTTMWGPADDSRPEHLPLAAGFWQGSRSVEVVVAGTVVAVCAVPVGPCRATGQPPPLTGTGP